jgi:hypothetical protein
MSVKLKLVFEQLKQIKNLKKYKCANNKNICGTLKTNLERAFEVPKKE